MRFRKTLTAFLVILLGAMCIPFANADENTVTVLIQSEAVSGTYAEHVTGTYDPGDHLPWYELGFASRQEAEQALAAFGTENGEINTVISLTDTPDLTFTAVYRPLARLNELIQESENETGLIALIGKGSDDPSVRQVSFVPADEPADSEETDPLRERYGQKLLSIRAFNQSGCSDSAVLCSAILYAVSQNAETIILPVSRLSVDSHPILADVLQYAEDHGAAVFESVSDFLNQRNRSSEIASFEASVRDGLILDEENGEYVWFPETSADNQRFTYRISYSLNGVYDLEAEQVKIRLPMHILNTRENETGDFYEMSVLHESESEEEDDFAWRIVDDQIEIFNRKQISAASEGFFEVSYVTEEETFHYRDGDHSASFDAEITIDRDGVTDTAYSSVNPFRVDTSSEILSTLKRYPVKSSVWNDLWMDRPEGTEDEEFLIWEVRSYIRQNSTQPYTLVLDDQIASEETETRILGYRFMGSGEFVQENTVTHQTADQLRTDYVLSAHKRSSAEQTVITNNITVTLIPEDGVDEPSSASGTAVYTEEKATFHEPAGSVGSEKYAGETLYNLELLQQGKTDKISGLPWHIIMEGYPYAWTREENSDPLDPSAYGKQKVKYVMTDDSICLNGQENRLNSGDYSIDSVSYSFLFEDADFNEEAQIFDAKEVTYDPEDTVIYYGLFENEWKQFAVASLFTGTWQINTSLAMHDENTFSFLEECAGIRVETENSHFHTRALFDLSVSLKDTPHVQELIRDQDRITLTNTETFSLVIGDEEIASVTRQANNFIRRTFRDSDLKKRVISTANDIAAKQYTVSWRVTLQEFITGMDGIREPYPQASGVFYDLLPAGCTLDDQSIHVYAENGEIAQEELEYEITGNFRHSGRTLLTVRIRKPADEYSLLYDTLHSWESIRDYGKSLLNPIAYETGNEDIADGYADNGTGLSDINRSYLSNLDEDCNTERFVYTEQPHDITAITSAIAGLRKKVKGDHPQYSYADVTSSNELYSYRLRYETSSDSRADHMIFFDSLENYVTEDEESSVWRGTLEEVDVSQLVEKGIAPKIYYSRVSDLNIEEHHDLSDSSIWQEALENLSEAKAVAIDMSKSTDGSDYVLQPSESVAAVLYMRAPQNGNTDPDSNRAYNNIWFSSSLHGTFNDEEDYLIRQDYTMIELHQKADIRLKKVNSADPTETIPGIAFRLFGTSDYGEPISVEKKTNSDGILIFEGIDRGTYQLEEAGNQPDWINDRIMKAVRIDSEGDVWIDETLCDEDPFVILNQKRVHADLTIEKRDSVHHDRPVGGALFRLSGTSDYGNEIAVYGESNTYGTITFKDIEAGTYILQESKAAQGYIKMEDALTVTLNEEGVFEIEGCETDESGRFVIYNEPLHELKLIKQNSYDGAALPGAVFTLKGVADDGTDVLLSATSDQRGTILFTGLHAGTYSLFETEAPEGFMRDTAVHAVRVNRDGTVECDDLLKNSQGIPIILNGPARNKTIRIIKRWMDDGNTERPVPTIHLSNTKPKTEASVLTIDIERWLDEDTGLAHIADAVWFEENTELSLDEVLLKDGIIRIDDEETESQMYIWPEDDGYAWWADADVIELPEDCSGLFASCSQLEELDLSRFSSDNVTDMNGMFSLCFSLTELNLSHFNTSQVTDMSYMFYYCSSLTYLDLSGIDTSSVENMSSMFSYCSSLTELDLSSFETSLVARMDAMFAYDKNLSSIYVSDLWSTESVYSGRDMFKNCTKLPSYSKSKTDVTYAHYGEGGYLTYREYETAAVSRNTHLFGNLLSTVYADEEQDYCSNAANFITSSMSENEKETIMNSDEGYWQVMDENTWVYTFPVINDQEDFWFYEEVPEGWMSNADIYHPGTVRENTGTIINFYGVTPGNCEMNITKDVINENNANRKFRFGITLRNERSEPLSGRTVYGDTAFENGHAEVMIGGGETYRITGIPIGYFYLVEEEESDDYSITSTGASGVIMDEQTNVHFINTREETSEKTVNLTLRKKLSGRFEDMEEEEFVFHFFLGGLEPETEYSLSDGQIWFADENGGADFSYRLKEDESVTLLDLPSGATWQICEEGGDYLSSYEITTEDGNESLISPSKTNETRDHFLSTALETVGEHDILVTFTNQFEYVQNITVRKTCTYPTDEEFEFKAEFHGLEETDVIETELGNLMPDENGDIVRTFFLKDGESLTFRNIPVSVTYVFTEEACDWISEYRIEDIYGRGQVVKQFGTSSDTRQPLSTKEETVNQFEDVLITFTNFPTPVSLSISKEVRGNLGSKDEKFHFMMTLNEDGIPLSEADYELTENGVLKGAGTLSMDNSGKARFMLRNGETVRFKNLEPGTVFTVEENSERTGGYLCEVIHGEETQAGYFVTGRLNRDDTENAFTFINERNAVIPTGRTGIFNTAAFCILMLAAAILYKIV